MNQMRAQTGVSIERTIETGFGVVRVRVSAPDSEKCEIHPKQLLCCNLEFVIAHFPRCLLWHLVARTWICQ